MQKKNPPVTWWSRRTVQGRSSVRTSRGMFEAEEIGAKSGQFMMKIGAFLARKQARLCFIFVYIKQICMLRFFSEFGALLRFSEQLKTLPAEDMDEFDICLLPLWMFKQLILYHSQHY